MSLIVEILSFKGNLGNICAYIYIYEILKIKPR